ncbi:hypothetical protein [Tritonibacter horizontis]|uniref:Uncharacterized protein n=1 Tax=Tritonibacter horizontis TaxID=1768241 RepID=A0A132BQM2_9RHOB|nr:hypothetical protein [Tritonibacter horizontis]KUP90705.1 hypothetical protein TRIHO_45720 [Tritonibacter horizontis]
MKAMLAGFVLIGAIAVGSDFALDYAGFSAQERNSGAAVRLN